jgi:tetratricopeptide (TPR) repeat protein
VELRVALHLLGSSDEVARRLREAETLATALGDQRRLGRVLLLTSPNQWLKSLPGGHVEARSVAERGLAIARSLGDVGLEAMATFRHAQADYFLGSYAQSVAAAERNVEALQGDLLYERFDHTDAPAIASRIWQAMSLAELGEFDLARRRSLDGVRLAEGLHWSAVIAHTSVGYVDRLRGEMARAIPALERALQISAEAGYSLWLPFAASCLGHSYAAVGRIPEALPLLEQALEQTSRATGGALEARCLFLEGEVLLLAGDTEAAAHQANHALILAVERHERGHEAWTLRLLGEIAAHADPPDIEQAESYYRQALTLAEELGMRPLVAHCHLGLGTLYQQVGRGEEATAELASATELYRAMEMPFWLEKAEAALGTGIDGPVRGDVS